MLELRGFRYLTSHMTELAYASRASRITLWQMIADAGIPTFADRGPEHTACKLQFVCTLTAANFNHFPLWESGMRTGHTTGFLVALAALASCVGAQAATQRIDTALLSIEYDDTQISLWGAPAITGSKIEFPNLSFDVSSLELPVGTTPPVPSVTGDSIRLTLIAHRGMQLTGIDWSGSGTYGIAETDAGAVNWVESYTRLQLFEAGQDVTIGGPIEADFSVLNLRTPPTEPQWSRSATLADFAPRQQLDIEISTLLSVSATEGPQVSISLDLTELQVTLVPLPPAALLFGGALVGLAGFLRRRKR